MIALKDVADSLFSTLGHFVPRLGPNVLAMCIGSLLLTWTGYNVLRSLNDLYRPTTVSAPRGLVDLALVSYTVGAFYALSLMYLLGSIGWFKPLALWVAILFPLVLRGRKAFTLTVSIAKERFGIIPFAVLVAGPLLISLTNPLPTWLDALEGNVAPIQRLIAFSTYDAATALPSALYPLDRATPLHTATHALIAQLFGLNAHQALAASLVPTLLLLFLSAHRLGSVLLPQSKHSGWIAGSSLVFTQAYHELQSARSTLWAVIFAFLALAKAVEVVRRPNDFELLLTCAAATAATVLAHPFEGAFTTLAVFLIVAAGFTVDAKRDVRLVLIAALVGVGFASPLLWSWWPNRPLTAVVVSLMVLTIPVAIGAGTTTHTVVRAIEPRFSRRMMLWPMLIVVSTVFLFWHFIGTPSRSFFLQAAVRYPIPMCLTVSSMFIALRGRTQMPSIVGGVAIAVASLPLWILPYLRLSHTQFASFEYEIPLKGMYYWLSAILAICGSVVLAEVWTRSSISSRNVAIAYRLAVIAVLVFPTSILLRALLHDHEPTIGLVGTLELQAKVVLNGYWAGWGDSRWLISNGDQELYRFVDEQIERGKITFTDRVAHVASRPKLPTTTFPVFTGVTEDLYLAQVDSTDIHTHGGRLFNITSHRPPRGWILIERGMLPYYAVDSSTIRYENAEVVLANNRRK